MEFSGRFSTKNTTSWFVRFFLGLLVLSTLAPEVMAQSQPLWLGDLSADDSITQETALDLMPAIVASVKQSKGFTVPGDYDDDNASRIVFISVSDGKSPAVVEMGAGVGFKAAIISALNKINQHTETVKWVKLDIVKEVSKKQNVHLKKLANNSYGLLGYASEKDRGLAFLPDELLAYDPGHMKDGYAMSPRQQLLKAFSTLQSQQNLPVYLFSTFSVFADDDGIHPEYRGHSIISIDKKLLETSLETAGHYLATAVKEDGRFSYSYQASTDSEYKDYNMLRHAGTIYAMMQVYQLNHDPMLLESAKKAIDYLVKRINPCAHNHNMSCIAVKGEAKLGGNGLAIIALAKYTEVTQDQQYKPLMIRMARWIASVQANNGGFIVGNHPSFFAQDMNYSLVFYPGEASLAMLRLYKIDPNPQWLNVAAKGAKFLILERDKGLSVKQLSSDHWLLYTLNELYRLRKDKIFLNHAFKLARATMLNQNVSPEYPDWYGGYYSSMFSTPAATSSEGLYAAYKLARDYGDKKTADEILMVLTFGVYFQLKTQFTPESVMYLPNPERALGGFRRSLVDSEVRIDYVQHNISSILGFYSLEKC